MELRQLRYFVTAAETLNFSRAAEALFISQPTLSLAISQLENSLGVKLFLRGKSFKTSRLTPAGEFFLPRAKELLAAADALEREIRALHGTAPEDAVLRIGLDDKLDRRMLARTMLLFRGIHPGVELQAVNVEGEALSEQLCKGKIDIGFTVYNMDPDNTALRWMELNRLPLYLAVERGYADAMNRDPRRILQEKPLYLVRDPIAQAHILSTLHKHGVFPRVVTSENRLKVATYVEAGMGVTIMHSSAISAYSAGEICLVDLSSNGLVINICAAYAASSRQSPLIEAFLSVYQRSIGAEHTSGENTP